MNTNYFNIITIFVVTLVGVVVAFYENAILVLLLIIVIIIGLLTLCCLVFSSEIKPNLYDLLLFLALFSGPPRLRSRDPMASLRGEIDWVVLLHLIVWSFGVLWVFWQIFTNRKLKLTRLETVAVLFASTIALSILVSPAPYLTGFRAFQIFAMILFAHYWVQRYNVELTLKTLLFGYMVLGITIAISALVQPELVYTDTFRLRGDYIANAGAVGVIGLILILSLFSRVRRPWIILFLFVPLLTWILIASRTRSAYAAFILFLMLLVLRTPRVVSLRLLKYLIIASIPALILLSDNIIKFLVREPESLNTLSDRTRIWAELFSYTLNKSPFLGLGFYTERTITLLINPGIGTAHGALAMVFTGAGILGTITFVSLLVVLLGKATGIFLKSSRNIYAFAILSVLLGVFSIGVVSEEMVVASPTGFTFYLMPSLLSALSLLAKDDQSMKMTYENTSHSQLLSTTRR